MVFSQSWCVLSLVIISATLSTSLDSCIAENAAVVGYLEIRSDINNSFLNKASYSICQLDPAVHPVYQFHDGESANFTCQKSNGTKVMLTHIAKNSSVLSKTDYEEADAVSMYVQLNVTMNDTQVECAIYTNQKPYIVRLKMLLKKDTCADLQSRKEEEKSEERTALVPVFAALAGCLIISMVLAIAWRYWSNSKKVSAYPSSDHLVRAESRVSIISHQYEIIQENNVYDIPIERCTQSTHDISQRPFYPVVLAETNENIPYIHYDTPYENRLFRIGGPVLQIPEQAWHGRHYPLTHCPR